MPLTRKQIYGRRRLAVFGGIAVVLLIGVYLPFTLLAPLGTAHAMVSTVDVSPGAKATVAWPSFGASAFGAVGYDGLLETSGSPAPMPIASISKIVTALVVLQAKPLATGDEGPTITFTQDDHDLYAKYLALQGTVKAMPTGASMSEHQVLQVALIASANNYATALADWAFGSEGAFVTASSSWLTAHGLTHTTLVEPTGIDASNTSTASDLVALGKLAIANPIIAPIVDTPTLTLPIVGTIDDTNKLLGQDGIVGIKTGTLTISNLLFASQYQVGGSTVIIIGAILGGDRDTIYPAVSTALASIKKGFHPITLAAKGQSFAEYDTEWGQRTHAVAARTARAVIWGNTAVTSTIVPAGIRSGERGSAAGAVRFRVGTTRIDVPLVLSGPLSDPGPWWRLGNPLATIGLE
ncbi:MAG: D-alanyl-D-alanine carboxypeptidase [Actinomycetota bacterium]